MTKVAQKFTDIALIGQDTSIELVKKVLSFQSKRTVRHYDGRNIRFVSKNTVVVDGEKVSAKKFLIAPTTAYTEKSYSVSNESIQDMSDAKKQDNKSTTCIIGCDSKAVDLCLEHLTLENRVILLCESTLLPGYDTSVQDTVERYLRKGGVDIVMDVTVLSLAYRGDTVHIVGNVPSGPYRIAVDSLVIVPDTRAPIDIGIENTSTSTEAPIGEQITKFSGDIAIINNSSLLGLSTVFELASFLCGASKASFHSVHRTMHSSNKLTFISIGILEQDYFNTHFSYKKCIVKVQGADKSPVQWFLKVLTSTHNKILGVHAVLPFNYPNIDLLIKLVDSSAHITELANTAPANDELADTFIEAIGNLTKA